jgi:hypothetical protein
MQGFRACAFNPHRGTTPASFTVLTQSKGIHEGGSCSITPGRRTVAVETLVMLAVCCMCLWALDCRRSGSHIAMHSRFSMPLASTPWVRGAG